jgi:hypothetical protein
VSGELRHVWLVAIPSGTGAVTEVKLPHWCTDPIDIVIAKWVAEYDKWQEEATARTASGKDLRPARQALYDAFLAAPERKCPLHVAFTFCTTIYVER